MDETQEDTVKQKGKKEPKSNQILSKSTVLFVYTFAFYRNRENSSYRRRHIVVVSLDN